jgi:hypothetical protein
MQPRRAERRKAQKCGKEEAGFIEHTLDGFIELGEQYVYEGQKL